MEKETVEWKQKPSKQIEQLSAKRTSTQTWKEILRAKKVV